MSLTESKAGIKAVRDILRDRKYKIEFFQRGYTWKRPQIEQLINDLESKFSTQYESGDDVEQVKDYEKYYMGAIITNSTDSEYSIIDGQQRLTTITLLLIYLDSLQKANPGSMQVPVNELVFSEEYGTRSYNIENKTRWECIESLYYNTKYDPEAESEINIVNAYQNITDLFPYGSDYPLLSHFIWWLICKVSFVDIAMTSSDDAYSIFETMNNRGLRLTYTEMLKGYILSGAGSITKEENLDEQWKENISRLKEISTDEDSYFFTAWLRAKYADTIRLGKKSAKNEDFERVGTRFNMWIKENEKKMGIEDESGFADFVNKRFTFYSKMYKKIHSATEKFNKNLEYVYYVKKLDVAPSFYYPMMIAPINPKDDTATINKKMNMVGRFLEMFYIFGKVNNKPIGYSWIKITMFNIIKDVRDKNIDDLARILETATNNIGCRLDGMSEYGIKIRTKKHIHYILARMTNHVEERSKMDTSFDKYITKKAGDPFTLEHLLPNKFERYKEEFDDEDDFEMWRNKIGALILVPDSLNKAYAAHSYDEKLEHYFGQNILAMSLNPNCYVKNPEFLRYRDESKMPFEQHLEFKKQDIEKRQMLYQRICEEIWKVDGFAEC